MYIACKCISCFFLTNKTSFLFLCSILFNFSFLLPPTFLYQAGARCPWQMHQSLWCRGPNTGGGLLFQRYSSLKGESEQERQTDRDREWGEWRGDKSERERDRGWAQDRVVAPAINRKLSHVWLPGLVSQTHTVTYAAVQNKIAPYSNILAPVLLYIYYLLS